jgi:predicted nuclease of predicted toxin-antitoxin system
MQLLADENVPVAAVRALREAGHDVVWIRDVAPRSKDREVLARGQHEKRVVVTFDKDFGELAFRQRLPASCGIILFRIAAPSPAELVRKVLVALSSPREWTGHLSVVEEDRIRMTPLPERTEG